ncbi:MAG: AraC family transcriptional regulator [Algoriphagus sp.]|uniref:helix-turn-helix domain-containing protein n=1 Tax=Algoriphagus sp. TaxID=1872435 RepID=UPI00260D8000|nr:AraC family transcriptional regulator [Algoriphagus sp.]MDG1279282.1 AraC family transcriptional regulator [Algoriphagus sp.]
MDILLNFKELGYFISIIIGVQVSLVLFVFGIKKVRTNILLASSIFLKTHGIFLGSLISSGAMVYFPGLYRTGNLAGLLFAPFLYLYIRNVVYQNSLSWKDLIHLVPFLIFFVDFLPIYFLSSSEKLALILSEIENPAEFTNFNQSRFFPSNFYGIFRTVLIAFYWTLSIRIIYKNRKRFLKTKKQFGTTWLKWISLYLFLLLFSFLPYFIIGLNGDPMLAFDLIHFSVALVTIFAGIALLFFPKILYGLDEFEFIKNEQNEVDENLDKHVMSLEKVKELEVKVHKSLIDEKVFLIKGYSLADLARDTEIPSYLLTIYINKYLNCSFSDLINKERVNESIRMIENGHLEQKTFEGIADLCGFNNRNSFINSFKKYKGMTPSQYKNQLNIA